MRKHYFIFSGITITLQLFTGFGLNAANLLQQQQPFSTQVNAYYSVPLSGFNHDVIADGTGGEANTKTTTTIDFSNEYFSADFVPNTPYGSVASAAAYGGGLPVSGLVNSAVTSGLTYELAPYDSNNVLLLRPLTSNTGALNFQSTFKANEVYILWVATETQANNVGVTIYFGDGTSQVQNNQIAYDWVGGTTNVALGGLSRVGRGSTQWAQLNEFSQSGACKLFEKKIVILAANQAKEITGIGFSYTGSGNYQSLAVFAINVFGEPYVLGTEEQQLTKATIYPNPTSSQIRVNTSSGVKRLRAVNNLGQLTGESSSEILDVEQFRSGIYFLEIELTDGSKETMKFIKK
ncbi:T9SS type A sorting domain-containing protein [Flavobacterium silvaticum]|uniref:T9SS type A sorting domain-containing protein n=1 Tax=Flavobacterium silvaticum TaxID=1852020 RepID=A0A972FW90_9FLAO|nr:T9SS type A sorting domain-containing protein [Flavobacterium silvaticum]NMH29182.1 T9SS type A sorting domain-containing protein [Flavobacterium silvaticum]